MAGALTVSRLLRGLGPRRTVGLGLVLFAVGGALFSTPNVVLVLVGHTLLGYGVPPLVVSLNTSVQRLTPRHMQGRAAAAIGVCVGGPQAISIALGATLATVIDYRALAAVMCATMIGGAAYILTRKAGPDDLPSAVEVTAGAPEVAGAEDARLPAR